jgi:hypothetical protein
MSAQRIRTIFFRIGIGLAVVCALLAFFNLFDSNPRASRNAVDLVAIGAGLYVTALLAGWLTAKLIGRKDDQISN